MEFELAVQYVIDYATESFPASVVRLVLSSLLAFQVIIANNFLTFSPIFRRKISVTSNTSW